MTDRFYGSDDPDPIVSVVSLTSYQTRGHILPVFSLDTIDSYKEWIESCFKNEGKISIWLLPINKKTKLPEIIAKLRQNFSLDKPDNMGVFRKQKVKPLTFFTAILMLCIR